MPPAAFAASSAFCITAKACPSIRGLTSVFVSSGLPMATEA
jgi:hypothetical protein